MALRALTTDFRGSQWLDCYNQIPYKEVSPCIRTGVDFRCMDYQIEIYEVDTDTD